MASDAIVGDIRLRSRRARDGGKMDFGTLKAANQAALAHHTQACVNEFCGIAGSSANYWERCQGFGRSEEDEKTFLVNLRLLVEMPDCPCRSVQGWREWKSGFERGIPLPTLNNWVRYHGVGWD